jgi:actin-related protein
VKVVAHAMQRYAVWFGGSLAASTVRKIFEKYNYYFLSLA